ncbi:MAG: hypothetical protein DRN16_01560 [Thermoplasmata archaeon]|nr:MAG: hypothetical protein DRN16_01560 [Thermoplasmata archaeon]
MKDDIPDDLEKRIISELGKGLMSVSQLANKLGVRRDFLTGYLECLRHQGKLEKMEVGKAYVYRVK